MIFGPVDAMRLATAWWKLASDTQAVMAYRMMGLSGLSKLPPTEMARMVAEKPPAFAEAAVAASTAALGGARPDQIAMAWMVPVSREARSNNHRLGRRKRR